MKEPRLTLEDFMVIKKVSRSHVSRHMRQRDIKNYRYEKLDRGRGRPKLTFGLSELTKEELAEYQLKYHSHDSSCAGANRGSDLVAETAITKDTERIVKESSLADFSTLPGCRKKEALARYEVIRSRDAFSRAANLGVRDGNEMFCREFRAGAVNLEGWILEAVSTKLSASTLYRWDQRFRDFGMAGLARAYKNHTESSIPEHMQKFVVAMKVEHPHVTITKINASLEARFAGQTIPHVSSLRRYVRRWEKKNASLLSYITNPDQWRNEKQFAAGDAAENVERLNQLWEMDSTPGDVMLIDGRHTIIGVIDVYSRRAKLLISKTSNSQAISALMRRAILDWGVPEVIRTDNGNDYTANHITRVLENLDIERDLCAPFSPEQKPFVERVLGTFSHDIVELLPGYVGHCVADRKAIEARRSFSQRLMSQGVDPVEIEMSAAEFQEICNRWIDAIYHHNSHSGLMGKTPSQVARQWTEPIRSISDERALDVLLSPAPRDGGFRNIGKKGLAVERGHYIAPEMAGHEGERVQALLDMTDFGCVYVYRENGEYLCRAADPERAGISRSGLAKSVRHAQKRVMKDGRKELKRVASEMKVRTINEEILAHRESHIRNVTEMPKKRSEYTTRALDQAAVAVSDIRRATEGPTPIEITPEQEARANEVIALADRKRPLPANDWEKYEQLLDDYRGGVDLPDADLAWMKRYEDRTFGLADKEAGKLAGRQAYKPVR